VPFGKYLVNTGNVAMMDYTMTEMSETETAFVSVPRFPNNSIRINSIIYKNHAAISVK